MTWLLLASKESRSRRPCPSTALSRTGNLAGSKAAVLGIYAELDSRVNASRAAARAALRKAGLRHQIVTYPGVDHAFFNPTERGTIRPQPRPRIADGELVRDVRCERVGRASVSVSRCSRCSRAAPVPGRARRHSASASIQSRREAGHDVAPARDGGVWYTAQGSGELGWLDPKTGRTRHVRLGSGSAPHGVIVGPDGAPWITDSGLNAIVRVDPNTRRVRRFPLPASSGYANLNTAVFDRRGVLWFTGQSGIYGRLDPRVGKVRVFRAPRGAGPYGITTTPSGDVYYASLAGSYLGRIDVARSTARVLQPPTRNQGARRAWSDSKGGSG